MSALHLAHMMWFWFTIWQIQATLLVVGTITGALLRVSRRSWQTAAILFVAWGFLFEASLAIGASFTPYGGPASYTIHIAFMVYRLTFAAGMIAGIYVSDRVSIRWLP